MYFTVILNDTTDVIEKSQCAISLRYVKKKKTKTGELKESFFLGFYDVRSSETVESLMIISNCSIRTI